PNRRWQPKRYTGLLIALSVIIVPFRIGFDAAAEGVWVGVDMVVDLTFFLDILFSLRLAYSDPNDVLVTVPRMIVVHYARTWLFLDVMSTVPFDRHLSRAASSSRNVFRGLKLVRVLRVVRLLRLFRLLKVAQFKILSEEFVELNTVLFRGLKLLLTLALLGHLFGCFWSFVSLHNTDTEDSVTSSSSSSSSSVSLSSSITNATTTLATTDIDNTWWGGLGIDTDDLIGRYTASIYWAFTTMTTVGYGDIVPVVDLERVYSTVIMVIGATVFGYIVGSVSALASNPNGSQARETEKLLAVSNYLDEKKIQMKLRQ
ncbi:unnamed protein product, partial [Discosporangium mesarthrocarpum]